MGIVLPIEGALGTAVSKQKSGWNALNYQHHVLFIPNTSSNTLWVQPHHPKEEAQWDQARLTCRQEQGINNPLSSTAKMGQNYLPLSTC